MGFYEVFALENFDLVRIFPRETELKNPNRAGEILRDGKNLDERLQGANRKTPVKYPEPKARMQWGRAPQFRRTRSGEVSFLLYRTLS